jgi:hypothetical protein
LARRLLAYALGGGLGPVSRTRAVLAATGWDGEVAVLAAPGAERAAGGLELLVPGFDDAAEPAALGRWVGRAIAEREPEVLLVDAFPGGVLGELCGLAALDGLQLRHVARLLRWGVYARRCEAPLPRYDRVHVVEPLHPAHTRALARLSDGIAPLALPPPPDPPAAGAGPGAPWLVVHTGPAREVRALARIADERRGDAPLHVVAPIRVGDLPAGAERIDAVPAAPLYAGAAGIVTAAGFNTVRELAPHRERHVCVPFERRLDDQRARAKRLLRRASGDTSGIESGAA